MSSLNYDHLSHLKIPLKDILSTTHNFAKKFYFGEADFGYCYVGKLMWSGELIDITVVRWNKEWDEKEQRFWMEIFMLSTLKHKNLVSLLGFCDENDEKIIIYKLETNGSLRNYLSDSKLLTWLRRLEICVGLAHALSYIHYDEQRDFSVIHRNIDSVTVLLNENWEPKLSDFRLSMKITKSQRHLSFDTGKVSNRLGYTDPTYPEPKSAHHKSDTYSFGIVMFELLCGRQAVMDDDHDNKYLASVAVARYREKKLDEIIDWDLWNQMDSESFNIFAEIAYDCLNEERLERPNIDEIVTRLEKALELQLEHHNAIVSSRMDNLAHLKIPFQSILSATNNFDYTNVVGRTIYEKSYKGQLSWSDELIEINARNYKKDRDEMFWTEVSMLSSLKHQNLVSFVGFCNENGEKIIITRREMKGSLHNYLSDATSLTWVQRLKISVSLAHALSYIHYDEARDFSVIHGDISSSTVLLNDNFEPKLSGFERSIKIEASQRHHSFHTSEVPGVDHKTDMYSFGIVLFELLCGRELVIDKQDNKYLAPVAIFHYREKTLDDIIDPDLLKQMDPQSFNIFTETAYECLNAEQSQCPNIDQIVTGLEKALELQLERENAVHSSLVNEVGETSSSHEEGSASYFASKDVESNSSKETMSSFEYPSHSQLSFADILSATNNFKNIIDPYGFGRFFQGRMLHSGQFIDIVVQVIRHFIQNEKRKFRMEKSIVSSLNHTNLVSVIGFCEENEYRKYIVYKKEANGSLNEHLSDKTLTWMQRLKICLGVANALSYIHYDVGRDFSVIHCNIRSSKILLDDKWEPKLCGFEFSLKNTVPQRHHLLLTHNIVKDVYLDPKYKNTGGLTHKSDVYSFGVVLFEVVCGMSAIVDNQLGEGLLSKLAKSHLIDMIMPHLRKQMDPQSFEILCGMSAIDEDEDDGSSDDEEEDDDEDDDSSDEEEEDEDEDDDEDDDSSDDEEEDEGLLSKLAKSHLDDMIMPYLRKQMDTESLKIFSETAYWCIKEDRADRPYVDQVVKRLKKALEHQWKHENPVLERTTSPIQLKGNLEHLKIELNDIIEATNNFDDAYIIGSGGFGKVYIADLEHFDSSNSSLIEGVDKCDLPRKRSTVAIKRINNQEGEQGFIAEIETLTSCKHENIISLLGFCYEGNGTMILVYEHASKGSLENYLGSSDKMANLNWLQRLNICLAIAHGLSYIHKKKMIHRDIKSDNILLGDNWKAKIADFGLSKFYPADKLASTFYTSMIAGTYVYLDPEYEKDAKLSKKSDIYSFGVVLLEILTGRLAYDYVYTKVNEKGIAPIARDHFEKGTIMEFVDHKIKEETDEHVFSLSKGPNKESLDIFLEIAFRCVAETQVQRPTIDVVIKELKTALNCQVNHKDNLKLSLEDVKFATQDFSQDNIIGHEDFGNVYRGIVTHAHGHNIIAAKQLDRESVLKDAKFMTELEILMDYKHENVIGLVGYCDEEDEKIIVYEYTSRDSLDKYLSDDRLTWVMRLKICINIAAGLEFLHGSVSSPEMVIHRDISSRNILLFDDWKAKITGFGLSLVCPTNRNVDDVFDNVRGTIGYRDPLHSETGFLTKESDIFSLGAVLLDILCGKLSSEKLDDEYLYLPFLAKHHYHVGKLDKLVFQGIKEQIAPQSYITFTRIAFQCLHHKRERRPTADEVVIQLKKSLEFQEDYEKWEPKLPKDYKEIIQKSKCPDDYSTIKKEEVYNIFLKGILLQQDKVLLSFVGNGERNAMVSATMFTYVNSCPHKWRSLKESRFEKVAELSDISSLNIEIETDTQLLSQNIVYGVYLVFKLCDSRKFSTKPMYVNLKYRKGGKTLQSHFATQRDENWMMIELYRFLNQNDDVVFMFLLESFSSYYCGDGAIYVEGIEFRAIDKVKHDEIGYLKEVQQVLKSNYNVDQVQQLQTEEILEIHNNYDELFWLGEVDGKKLLVLSAKAALYNFSNVDLFTSKPSPESRFQEVIELLPQQVFYINCTFRSQMLSLDTEYMCYLVFKISEQYQELHNPVRVRDLLRGENEEGESFIYLITPNGLNIHDFSGVPKQREDGWMEIQVWKFNSTHELKDDSLSINMKFTSHEGPMSGLIVCGLEFRPL